MRHQLSELVNKKDLLLGLAFKDFANFLGAGRETCNGFHFGITLSSEIQNNEKWFDSYELFKIFYTKSDLSSHLEQILFFGRKLRRFDEIRKAGCSWYEFWNGSVKPDDKLYLAHSTFVNELFQVVCNYFELDITVTPETIDNLPYDSLISLMLFHKNTDVIREEYKRLASDIFVDLNSKDQTIVVEDHFIFKFGHLVVTSPMKLIELVNRYEMHNVLPQYDGKIDNRVIDSLGELDHYVPDASILTGAFYRIK